MKTAFNATTIFIKGKLQAMAQLTQQQRDDRIQALHSQAIVMFPKLEKIIDELKKLGPHTLDNANAISNTQQQLSDLSERCKTRTW